MVTNVDFPQGQVYPTTLRILVATSCPGKKYWHWLKQKIVFTLTLVSKPDSKFFVAEEYKMILGFLPLLS